MFLTHICIRYIRFILFYIFKSIFKKMMKSESFEITNEIVTKSNRRYLQIPRQIFYTVLIVTIVALIGLIVGIIVLAVKNSDSSNANNQGTFN